MSTILGFVLVQKGAVSPAETVDALSNKVITLARRFYPSEVALPLRKLIVTSLMLGRSVLTFLFVSLAIVISQLEEFAMVDLEPEASTSGQNDDKMWIVNSLHEGGVPWQVLYEHYDILFRERVSRDHTLVIVAWASQAKVSLSPNSCHPLTMLQVWRTSFQASSAYSAAG